MKCRNHRSLVQRTGLFLVLWFFLSVVSAVYAADELQLSSVIPKHQIPGGTDFLYITQTFYRNVSAYPIVVTVHVNERSGNLQGPTDSDYDTGSGVIQPGALLELDFEEGIDPSSNERIWRERTFVIGSEVIEPVDLQLSAFPSPASASIVAAPTSIVLGESVTLTLGESLAASSGRQLDGPGLSSNPLADPASSVSAIPVAVGAATYFYTVPGGKVTLRWLSNSPSGTFTLHLPDSTTVDVTGGFLYDTQTPGDYYITQTNTAGSADSTKLTVSLPAAAVATASVTVLEAPTVDLSLDSGTLVLGNNTQAHSKGGPAGVLASHILEYRLQDLGNPQAWSQVVSWGDVGGATQDQVVGAALPVGKYEFRAMAARSIGAPAYSSVGVLNVINPVAIVASTSGSVLTKTPAATIAASPDSGTVSLSTTVSWATSDAGSFVVQRNGSDWETNGTQKVDTLAVGAYSYKIIAQPTAYQASIGWNVTTATGAITVQVKGPSGYDSGLIAATLNTPGSVVVGAPGTYTVTTKDGFNTADWDVTVGSVSAVSASTSVTVVKGDQTVSIDPLSVTVAPGDQVTFTGQNAKTSTFAWGGATSGSAISNTFTPPGVENDYTVTFQALADPSYNASNLASATVKVRKITQAALTLGATTPQVYGTSQPLTADGGSGVGGLSYVIVAFDAPGRAHIANGDNLVADSGIGWVDVQATKASDVRYLAQQSNIVRVFFAKAAQSISIVGSTPQTFQTFQTISTKGSSGVGAITLQMTGVSAPGAATFNSPSLTANTGNGWAEITASIDTDDNYLGATSTVARINFQRADQTITLSASTPQTYNTDQTLGSSQSGTGAITFAKVGESSVGAGSLSGAILHANMGNGWVDVQAHADQDDNYKVATSPTVRVQFQRADQTITVSASSPQTYNTNQTLATSQSGTGTITFAKVGESSIGAGSLSGPGNAILHADTGTGWVRVQASITADDNFNAAVSAVLQVDFALAPQTISVTASTPQTYNTDQLLGSSQPGTGAVTFAKTNESVVNAGTLSGAGHGTLHANTGIDWVEVQASIVADSNYDAAVSVPFRVQFQKANQVISVVAVSPQTYDTHQTLSSTNSSGTGAVSFLPAAQSAFGVGVLSGAGNTDLYANTGTGWIEVQATILADNNYNAATSPSFRVTFKQAPQAALTLNAAITQSFATNQTLSTTGGSGTGLVTYDFTGQSAIGAGTIGGATLTANTGTGWLEVQATKAGDLNYLPVTSQIVHIDLLLASQTLLLNPMTSLVAPGDTVSYNASGAKTSYVWGGIGSGGGSSKTVTVPGAEGVFTVTVYAPADLNYAASPTLTASITATPTEMTAFTPLVSNFTVTAEGPLQGRVFKRVWNDTGWNAYLGRSGVKFSLTGRGTHAVVGFELQALNTSTSAEWTTIATGGPDDNQTNGSGLNLNATFSVMLGTQLDGAALVPQSYADGHALIGTWQFRGRVQDTDSRWSPWAAVVPVNVVLPLVDTTVNAKTVPPAGDMGAWFIQSDSKDFPFKVWIP